MAGMPPRARPGPRGRPSPSPGVSPEPPRKKVRKGTRSCWECKRRKIRCIFTGPTDLVCGECRRRRTACISQEFPDEPAGGGSKERAVEDRLGRVEALVERLAEQLARDSGDNGKANPTDLSSFVLPQDGHSRLPATSNRARGILATSLLPSPRALTPATAVVTCTQDTRAATKYGDLSRKLFAAWPSEDHLALLLSVPTGASELLLSKAAYGAHAGSATPRDVLRLPPPGSHPVLIARNLLLLAIFLHEASSSPASHTLLTSGSPSCHDIVSQAVEAASLVTGNDELATSVEGIECLMMESMYHDTAGNLRRAWVAIRRAIAMTQMMGLHRSVAGNSNEPQADIDPSQMWFRLVQADRYMSLMLGLPQGSSESVFAAPKVLEICTPVERMRRFDCLAAGRILQRSAADLNNPAETREIDRLLQQAAACMPPQWWLPPDFALSSPGEDSTQGLPLDETMRFIDQYVHYHLLARLHLPYLLPSPTNNKHDHLYSKITAVNASREVVTRFVSFRSICPTASYCRGVDFLAFIACSTLCLAHIEACGQSQGRLEDAGNAGSSDLGFLVHQRPGDCGLLELALASLQQVASANNDEVASKMATVLRHLLVIEDDAAGGGSYRTSYRTDSSLSSPEYGTSEIGGIAVGKMNDEGNVLHIHIPHFGTVDIEKLSARGIGDNMEQWTFSGMDMAVYDFIGGLEGADAADAAAEEPWTGWVDDGPAS